MLKCPFVPHLSSHWAYSLWLIKKCELGEPFGWRVYLSFWILLGFQSIFQGCTYTLYLVRVSISLLEQGVWLIWVCPRIDLHNNKPCLIDCRLISATWFRCSVFGLFLKFNFLFFFSSLEDEQWFKFGGVITLRNKSYLFS